MITDFPPRLRSMLTVLTRLSDAGLAALALGFCWLALHPDLPVAMAADAVGLPPPAEPAAWLFPVLLLLAAAAFGTMAGMLWQVRRLFAAYRRGEVFTAGPAATLRRLGWWLIALAPALVAVRSLAGLAVSLGDRAEGGVLAVSVDSGTYAALLFGGLMLAIGWVMGRAAELADENRAFV